MNITDMIKAIYDDSYVRKEYLFLPGIDENKIKWSGTFTNTSDCLYIYNTSTSPSYAYSEEIDFTDINAIYSYCMFYAVNGGNITFYDEVVKESDKLNMDTAVDLVYGIYNANATGYGGSITFDTSKITGKTAVRVRNNRRNSSSSAALCVIPYIVGFK